MPATHDAVPDRVPLAESAESAATVPLPSVNFHQWVTVGVGVALGVDVAVPVDVGVAVGVALVLDVGVGIGVGVIVGVGGIVDVGVGLGPVVVTLAWVESALSPPPLEPPVKSAETT
jgi:hypothetical protein